MNYTLAVVTHGDGRTLRRTLESFAERVTPKPEAVRVFADSMEAPVYAEAVRFTADIFPPPSRVAFMATHPGRKAGFCNATARLWGIAAAHTAADYVFWLEHDFVFLRDVDHFTLADTLDAVTDLAQMALIRDAANTVEVRAGGLVASRPGEFIETTMRDDQGVEQIWLEHSSYFTTNPSLMRREFMEANPFPEDGEPGCEGRYGIALRERGYRFAAWGDGSEWVAHMGIRDGSGTGY